ncbi:MAG: GNAT family protein [Tissierellia bacterium]|nr:GNAT family protein [Tissierellia bacterium]
MRTPDILTPRLRIRSAQEADLPWVIALEEDPENAPYIWVGNLEEHREELASPDHLLYVFERREDQEKVGYALVQLNKKARAYLLRRIAINKKREGYGEEAMRALMASCFDQLDQNRFWLDVFPDNPAGIALYEKLGMVREGVLRENDRQDRGYLDQIVYGILKREWEKIKD